MIKSGKVAPFCLVAEMQTGGYGRHGKKFYSPMGGLYMSLVLPVEMFKSEIITEIIAERLLNVIKRYNPDAVIKPINDILLHGKKIAGILVEKTNNHFIIGIGINLRQTEPIPKELENIIGFLDADIDVDEIIRALN